MVTLKPPLRLANEHDAPALADLVNFAGEGLPLYLWENIAEAGQDPWQIGQMRQAAKTREGQIYVIDQGDGAIAGLTGYAIGAEPEATGDDFPALFRPLQELENLALNSWYINVLACYPHHRGQGLGSRLMRLAEDIAKGAGLTRMSIIVAGNNARARRLYERHGYQMTATRPCIREGWDTKTESWALLMKEL